MTYPPEWLTLPQVSEELSVDYKTVLKWRDRKEDPLPCWLPDGNRKQVRVRRSEMNEWLERNWKRCNA